MGLLIHCFIDSSTYSFLPSFLTSFLPPFPPSCAHLFNHPISHSYIQSFVRSFIHSSIHSFIQNIQNIRNIQNIENIDSFIRSFVRSFIHSSCVHPSIHPFLMRPSVHPSIHPSLVHWFIGSLLYWFIGLLVRSVTCARILSCHAVGISTTICSFVDARDKFNSSLLLHLKKRSCRPLISYHHFMPFLQEGLNIPSEHTPTLGHAGFIWFLLFGYCTQNILVISVSKLYTSSTAQGGGGSFRIGNL